MKNLQFATLIMLAISVTAAGDLTRAQPKSQDDPTTQSAFRPVLEKSSRSGKGDKKEKLVKVRIFPLYDKLPRGEKCPVAVELEVRDGWHIHANPAHPDYTIPTEVKLRSDQKVKLTKVRFPKHHLHRMKDETEDSHVYDGKVIIHVLLEIDAGEKANEAELEFEVAYQACNSELCRRPNKILMRGKLPLANPGDNINRINEDKFKTDKDDKEEDGEK